MWVAGGDSGTLTGIDQATNRVIATARLHPFLCCVAVGGGAVWAAEAHAVAKVSPEGRVLRRFGVGTAGIGDLAFDRGYVWATADTTGRLVRIGARHGDVRRTQLGNVLIGTAARGGIVAVAATAPDIGGTEGLGRKVIRIGLTQDWLNITDPAVTPSRSGTGQWRWQLHHATCAELYQHPDAGGASGAALQPELASAHPADRPMGASGRSRCTQTSDSHHR